MKLWEAIILGLVQGIAEFLPISSSGHLSIIQNLFNIQSAEEDHMLFNVLLHFATLISVCIFYWSDVREMLQAAVGIVSPDRTKERKKKNPAGRLIIMIVAATIPLVFVMPIKSQLEKLNTSTSFIGIALILTGFMLFVSDKMAVGSKTSKNMKIRDGLIIGICQAVAVIPGLSRSGTTITAGIATGLDREFAVKFSFLISIPAVLGATLLEIIDLFSVGIDIKLIPVYLVGMLVAGFVGYLSISIVKYIGKSGKFGRFAYYCWVVGVLTIILSLI